MADRRFYFQVTFEGQATVQPTAYGQGETRRSVVVEIGPEALTPAEGVTPRAQEEAASEIARTTANEVIRDEIPTVSNLDGDAVRIGELPPVLQDVEPTIDDPGIRVWLMPSGDRDVEE
ncbi:MAG TPA: hypothetical protein VGD78_17805 [Chthoniobacterales bacterium]